MIKLGDKDKFRWLKQIWKEYFVADLEKIASQTNVLIAINLIVKIVISISNNRRRVYKSGRRQ